jgi:hypothetical protein
MGIEFKFATFKRATHSVAEELKYLSVKTFSNSQIMFDGKARFASKAERTRQYVSILN